VKDRVTMKGNIISDEIAIGKLVTNQLKKLFITYALAINVQENRNGSLFNPKFKRKEISDQEYLRLVIFYIHYNPEKHKISNDFRIYRYSSYKALTCHSETEMDREYVYAIFDDKEGFMNYHQLKKESAVVLRLDGSDLS